MFVLNLVKPILGLIFSIIALVGGIIALIMETRKSKKINRTLLGFVKENPHLEWAADKLRNEADNKSVLKAYFLIIIIGIVGTFICSIITIDILAENNVIVMDETSFIWQISENLMIFVLSIAAIIGGKFMISKNVPANREMDMDIVGKISSYQPMQKVFIGNGKPIVEYTDPYDGKTYTFKSDNEINKKKNPIGSTYKLKYSREHRRVYDRVTSRVNKEMAIILIVIGVIAMISAVVKIAFIFVV